MSELKLRIFIKKILLEKIEWNKPKNLQEQDSFDRINFYLEYYTNNSPSSFKVIREDNEIKISNII